MNNQINIVTRIVAESLWCGFIISSFSSRKLSVFVEKHYIFVISIELKTIVLYFFVMQFFE